MIQEQELSERKLKILQAIIKNYLETGEPALSSLPKLSLLFHADDCFR